MNEVPRFKVVVTVEAIVPATNAGDALVALCAEIRKGIGEEGLPRQYSSIISEGRATPIRKDEL